MNGFLVDVDDVGALSDKLAILLMEPGLRKKVGAASRDSVVRSFGVDKSIKQLLVLYRVLND